MSTKKIDLATLAELIGTEDKPKDAEATAPSIPNPASDAPAPEATQSTTSNDPASDTTKATEPAIDPSAAAALDAMKDASTDKPVDEQPAAADNTGNADDPNDINFVPPPAAKWRFNPTYVAGAAICAIALIAMVGILWPTATTPTTQRISVQEGPATVAPAPVNPETVPVFDTITMTCEVTTIWRDDFNFHCIGVGAPTLKKPVTFTGWADETHINTVLEFTLNGKVYKTTPFPVDTTKTGSLGELKFASK